MRKDKVIKIIKIFIMVIALFWGYTAFSLRHTEKEIQPSTLYSQREINSAMNTAARHFPLILTECKVTRLYYNEDKNISMGGDKNNIIVYCDFEVMYETPVWKKGDVRHGWSWTMHKVCGIWVVTNYGYA